MTKTGPRIAVAIPWKNLTGMSQSGAVINSYSTGAIRNTTPDATSSRFLPMRSEITPTGNEKRIPARGENAAMRPMRYCLPRLPARKGAGPDSWRWSSRILQKSPAGKDNTSSFVQGERHMVPEYPEHSS
jgi:hypothetical protein